MHMGYGHPGERARLCRSRDPLSTVILCCSRRRSAPPPPEAAAVSPGREPGQHVQLLAAQERLVIANRPRRCLSNVMRCVGPIQHTIQLIHFMSKLHVVTSNEYYMDSYLRRILLRCT